MLVPSGEAIDQLNRFLFGDVAVFELLLQISEEVLRRLSVLWAQRVQCHFVKSIDVDHFNSSCVSWSCQMRPL